MEKTELRNNMIQQLKKLPDSERTKIEQALAENLTDSDVWKQSNTIGITVSNGFEWNTKPIIEAAWQQGKLVCVPKCLPKKRQLNFYELNSYDQLEVVYHNLLEPKPEITEEMSKDRIDLLVVPGLLFDKNGYRIGFGGGYYDRFLTDFPNRKLSMAATIQLVNKLPRDPFDIPVEEIITENGFWQRGGG
ncbi:5-formyltetrahydrofolate cyclo-ligase [Lentibacillus amyloliquefaciens]|uniref:5-formyltetrahydrofolate cyclo-ligase n=1 Tax=Lentibacillus amyloliquefaciens TaxID=1472767 RepID=A0A0U4F3D1_9BACI|nr:5-formyltetrahydrofolate cyclo-ligase [Lentibacillus amyloliquefaciens]ALX48086.1 5-formyltetrahydrofolate cyclo-ligase [Lentibacillus amyloliquefaciens]